MPHLFWNRFDLICVLKGLFYIITPLRDQMALTPLSAPSEHFQASFCEGFTSFICNKFAIKYFTYTKTKVKRP